MNKTHKGPHVFLVGDGGKDRAAEEYVFVPKGSSVVIAPKASADEKPSIRNAAAAILRQIDSASKPIPAKKGAVLSAEKAKKMLHDGTANGQKLTDKQRRFFGFIAGGGKPTKAATGAVAGDTSGILAQLMSILPLILSDLPMSQLAYMNATGNIQPTGIFSDLQGGPSIALRQLIAQMTQNNAENALNQGTLDLNRELGLGNLDLQRQQLAQQLGLGQGDLDLRRQLGMGDLDLRRLLGLGDLDVRREGNDVQRYGIDVQKNLGEAQNAITAQNMLGTRAGRQLNAPGGNVIPSLQPILGRAIT